MSDSTETISRERLRGIYDLIGDLNRRLAEMEYSNSQSHSNKKLKKRYRKLQKKFDEVIGDYLQLKVKCDTYEEELDRLRNTLRGAGVDASIKETVELVSTVFGVKHPLLGKEVEMKTLTERIADFVEAHDIEMHNRRMDNL